jgi:UDP-3-O-[3-hydroxymyristoyl] glucosamine N-acyltransferase
MKLADIAAATGSVIEAGEPDLEIGGAAGLDLAGPSDVTFLANPKYTPQIAETRAGAIFLAAGVECGRADLAVLRAADPYVAYAQALHLFHPQPAVVEFVHPSAFVDPSATVAAGCEIHAGVAIGKNAVVGAGTRIFPNATIYDAAKVGSDCVIHSGVAVRENCEVGDRCNIHNNTTIGSDGFGYAKTADRKWFKIPQAGRVVLEDDVEVGANTAIDRASVGETRIKRGAKIDNLVQIGHSCTVDEDALICSQTGLAGSSVIGKRVVLAGQVGIAGHLKVGDDVVVTAKSATSHDIESGKIISGVPAFDNRDWLRSTAAFRRLGEFAGKLRDLQKRVSKLEEQ